MTPETPLRKFTHHPANHEPVLRLSLTESAAGYALSELIAPDHWRFTRLGKDRAEANAAYNAAFARQLAMMYPNRTAALEGELDNLAA